MSLGSLETLLFLMLLVSKKSASLTAITTPIQTNMIRKSWPVLDKKSASGTIIPNLPGVSEYSLTSCGLNICGKNK